MPYSSKKYILEVIKRIVLFFLFLLLMWLTSYADNVSFTLLLSITLPIGGIFFFIPSVYYLVIFFITLKKSKDITPKEALIVNWRRGFGKRSAALIATIDGIDYSTSAYFNLRMAHRYVGLNVSCAVILNKLFIYEIKG